ncbi:G-type lectin S-receptor-like serine/threonine-protein kinase SD3-1 [Cryptomeria japonica]|uniref:G-type lectin S-receptor-like serine/threonine-protein kinase SD3-1 n=1 Tax=Cryptomeria japonica TaxID=3369 RepID=UPI0027DA9BAA|nr:G-type lectin S-receptor-like serine/threonine-protein kinase SD3-1 [Cryptomeria japonica]
MSVVGSVMHARWALLFPPVSISLIVHNLLLSSPLSVHSFALPSTIAYGGTVWINNNESLDSWTTQSYGTGALTVRPILLTDNTSYNGENLRFGCGFFCYSVPCDTGYNFAAYFVLYETNYSDPDDLQMVWTANRERLVQENATLELTSSGDLVLKDSDGTVVWSTNTFTKDFQGMRIEESGNPVLLNRSNGTMWQSFDHPTDLLISGQRLEVGQKLIANSYYTASSVF